MTATAKHLEPKLSNAERQEFADAVISGLSKSHKTLPTQYLYDARGSALFEDITYLDEYYQTRTEISILEEHVPSWTTALAPDTVLVEFGSGSSRKTEILLAAPIITAYAPIDVSPAALDDAEQRLSQKFPQLDVYPIVGDFTAVRLPDALEDRPKAGFFPGSTIGNLSPVQAVRLLRGFAQLLGTGAQLMIGVDLRKDHDRLERAYDDAKGVTADFNLNLLRRINRELNAEFELASFQHRAIYNSDEGRIEMHLVSQRSQSVKVAGQSFSFETGETIHTENSYKYTIGGFRELADRAGWKSHAAWIDAENLFSVHVLIAG